MNQQQEERLFNMVQDTHDTVIEINTKVRAIEQICPQHAKDIHYLLSKDSKISGMVAVISVIISAGVAVIVAIAISAFKNLMGDK